MIAPEQPFNIIYSSGTTGAPKGIVQPHRMRWRQFTRVSYDGAVTLVSTPLYSNTTLVVFLPTLAHGGTAVLMPKFDAGAFLDLAESSPRDPCDAGARAVPTNHGARGFRALTTCRAS